MNSSRGHQHHSNPPFDEKKGTADLSRKPWNDHDLIELLKKNLKIESEIQQKALQSLQDLMIDVPRSKNKYALASDLFTAFNAIFFMDTLPPVRFIWQDSDVGDQTIRTELYSKPVHKVTELSATPDDDVSDIIEANLFLPSKGLFDETIYDIVLSMALLYKEYFSCTDFDCRSQEPRLDLAEWENVAKLGLGSKIGLKAKTIISSLYKRGEAVEF